MQKLLFSTIILALVFGLAACGGEEAEETTEEVVDDGVRTIEVFGTDDMKFVVNEAADGLRTGAQLGQYVFLEAIEASPGEEIRIRLTTNSNLPPTAMSHNMVFVELGTDVDAFSRASITARDNGYISPDFEGQVIISTDMLGNGESDTITFTVPETPGEYDYLCTFPGHYSGGMFGKLIVE